MRRNRDYLFVKGPLSGALDATRMKMFSEIDGLDQAAMQQPIEQVVDEMVERHRTDLPEIGDIRLSHREVKIDVSNDWSGAYEEHSRVTATEITVHMPFAGDAGIFQLHREGSSGSDGRRSRAMARARTPGSRVVHGHIASRSTTQDRAEA